MATLANMQQFSRPPMQAIGARQMLGPPATQQQVPQTGLIGSEQALLGGQYGSEMAMQGGLNQSTNTINQGMAGATGYILGGAAGAANAMNMGYKSAANALGGISPGYVAAQNNFSANTKVGSNITDPLNQGSTNFSPFLGGGQNAAKLQADLTGANGPEAQQAAYANYQSSPAMQYQMDQMQKATERSAAARGGALGGNVLMELQRNAAGIASQDYQNQFNNLGQVSGQGMNAASQIAGLKSQQAGIAGNLQQSGMQVDAQTALGNQAATNQQAMFAQEQKASIASKLADLSSMYGINTGNLLTSTGNLLGQAQIGAASRVAESQLGTGQLIGQSRYSTGTNLAAGRTSAGNAMAQNAGQAATNIGNLLSQQGLNISTEMSADIANTTKLIQDYGLQDKISNESLAAIIANITSGQATNAQNAYGNIGSAQAAGTMGMSNALQGGLTQGIQLGMLGGGGTGGGGGGAGATVNGYTGSAYKNWVAGQ